MIAESKIKEKFCMADDFYKFFDEQMGKYAFRGAPASSDATVNQRHSRQRTW